MNDHDTDHNTIESILQFWFGELDEYGYAAAERHKLWFQSSAETDAAIQKQFGHHVAQALQNDLDGWAQTPWGRLALIILLDQFTRNVYRGSRQAFSGDAKARQLTHEGLALGHDKTLAPAERVFFYLPLEHSENLNDQNQCVALYTELHQQAPEHYQARTKANIEYAAQHRDIIARFGRFPHRNKALSRDSTEDELCYLENANTFGQ